ncbi:MAG: major capsid protein [Microviridae sp.]|nr:MAG: major capsid protein [Microviridae sp.]
MKRSKFSLSNYKVLSANMGSLIPIGLTEVLPGDTIQQATSVLCRLSPMLAPVMHPVHMKVHHFFVPNRILWDDWEDFITGGPDGFNDSDFPTIGAPAQGFGIGSLADYLGVPPSAANLRVSALPFRAYAKIFNDWFRDQDLQAELPLATTSGVDSTTNRTLQNSAWEKDYFTTCRPWTQKGPEITLPLGKKAIVSHDVPSSGGTGTNDRLSAYSTAAGSFRSLGQQSTTYINSSTDVSDVSRSLYADLSTATAATINQLREAFALQRYEEARARYGSRYTEYLRYLGIRSSDARLQRSEYLGGGTQTIQISEVLQTGPENGGGGPSTPGGVADLYGHGIGAMRSNRYRKFFEEHGYVLTLLSVKPKTMYTQGLHRHWNRRTKEDFFQKELQHIGQQEVLNKELYADGTAADDNTFGYQDRYDEYRRCESSIAGEFRTSELDFWHMARIFQTRPTLNADFIKSVPTDRIFQVKTNDVLWVMANHSIQARRIVSKTGTSYIS